MTPDDRRHGTTAGYDAHRRAGQEACRPCRAAAARAEQERRLDQINGRPRTLDSRGVARRIQGLVAFGYSMGQIADALGRSHDLPQKWANQRGGVVRSSTAAAVADLYDAWCMTPPPMLTGRDRWRVNYARTVAAKNGWVPPLAWDDIDNDPHPHPEAAGEEDTSIDSVVVARVLSGQPCPTANRAERVEIVARWRDAGRPLADLERVTGWKPERYYTPPGREAVAS